MAGLLRTENCVFCGEPAIIWSGQVVGNMNYALGKRPTKVAAGHCALHEDRLVPYDMKYDPKVAGKCVPLFKR